MSDIAATVWGSAMVTTSVKLGDFTCSSVRLGGSVASCSDTVLVEAVVLAVAGVANGLSAMAAAVELAWTVASTGSGFLVKDNGATVLAIAAVFDSRGADSTISTVDVDERSLAVAETTVVKVAVDSPGKSSCCEERSCNSGFHLYKKVIIDLIFVFFVKAIKYQLVI